MKVIFMLKPCSNSFTFFVPFFMSKNNFLRWFFMKNLSKSNRRRKEKDVKGYLSLSVQTETRLSQIPILLLPLLSSSSFPLRCQQRVERMRNRHDDAFYGALACNFVQRLPFTKIHERVFVLGAGFSWFPRHLCLEMHFWFQFIFFRRSLACTRNNNKL